MDRAEVIVVGAGHNGLICAAYLARAGIETILVDARDSVGGCASTEHALGARFNICNCDHGLVRAMPVIDELDLAGHGLEYLENDVGFVYSFHDGSHPWLQFHDVERTLDSIAASHPSQVDGYRRYLDDALPIARLVVDMARRVPSAPRFAAGALSRRAAGVRRLLDWSRRSVDDVFADYFDDWRITMPAISIGPTVWGVPPETPGTGLAAAGYATRHVVKTGRPRGGSGALTDAIRDSFLAAGGTLRCGSRVAGLEVVDGSVAAVRLADGSRLHADVVVAACDPQRVFVDWIDEVPPAARRMVERWRAHPVHDGYESKIDAVLTGLPTPRVAERVHATHPGAELLGPTTVVSPSRAQLAEAFALRDAGRVAPEPTLLVNMPSVLDPSMAAPGEHILSIEVLFTPYALEGGWPGSAEPARWLELWASTMEPGALDLVDRWRAMTPDRYEAEFSMHRGHTPAFASSPLHSLLGRDHELTRYRTPISGLYLSGAATFPGAGVFGASGRNAAAVVRGDLRGPIGRRMAPLRRAATGVVGAAATRVGSA